MVMMKKWYIILCIIFCSVGCQQGKQQSAVPVFNLDPDSCMNELDISGILGDTVEVIKLETTDDCLIGQIDNIRFTDKYIFVSDLYTAQRLYMFDRYGKFICTIGNRGVGPGEYSVIGEFLVKGDSLLIQDYYQNKYLVYDIVKRRFMNDIHYKTHHSGAVTLNDNLYFVSSYFKSPLGDYNCFEFNLETGKTSAYLPFVRSKTVEQSSVALNHPCDYINEAKAFAHYFFNDTIYEIDQSGIRPQCVISFLRNTGGNDYHSIKEEGKIVGLVHLQQSEKYMLGIYTLGNGFRYFLMDKDALNSMSGELLRIKKLDNKIMLGEFFVQDGYFIFKETISSLKLWRTYFYKSKFLNLSDKQKIQDVIDSSKEEDNPIIFRYKLKE